MQPSQGPLLNPADEHFVLFDEISGVRRERYDEERYYSVVDIVAILTENKSADK
jgi:hypothetical protein